MMDKKYLAEIRARVQEAKAEKQKGNDLDCALLSWAIVLNDLPALLDEVERMADVEKEYLHYRRLSEKLDKQIATLKRALNTALNKSMGMWCSSTCEKKGCFDCLIQQAQEQEGHDEKV